MKRDRAKIEPLEMGSRITMTITLSDDPLCGECIKKQVLEALDEFWKNQDCCPKNGLDHSDKCCEGENKSICKIEFKKDFVPISYKVEIEEVEVPDLDGDVSGLSPRSAARYLLGLFE